VVDRVAGGSAGPLPPNLCGVAGIDVLGCLSAQGASISIAILSTNRIQTSPERKARFAGGRVLRGPAEGVVLPQVDAVLEAALGPGALAAIRAEPE